MAKLGPMDDHQIGAAIRTIRQRKRWRQRDLADRAGVSRWVVARVERGRLDRLPIASLRCVATALDARVDLTVRWQGGDLGRLVNSRHAAMHEAMARFFAGHSGWIAEPEVSFSIWGERGIVDVLAWHPATGSLPIIELKTELVDLNDLLGTLDRKRRLAAQIAGSRGWTPASVGAWVVVADSRTNRRAVALHAAALRAKLPTDGRGVGAWLTRPDRPLAALSFLPSVHGTHLGAPLAPVRRVSPRRPAPTARDASTD
jgi:transcriptional regulator with XRE-family HTH domain